LLIPVVAGAVVAADQASKTWALHHLGSSAHVGSTGRHIVGPVWLMLTFNSGAAFSLGRGATPVVEAVVIALVAWLLVFSRRASRTASVPMAVGLGLLLGGAAGNLADRVFRHIHGYPGAVIDFVDAVRIGTHDWWPVFNVADASIVVGVILLVGAYIHRPGGRDREARAVRPADAAHHG